MYRAVTLAFLRAGIHTPEALPEADVERFLREHAVSFQTVGKEQRVTLDGQPLGDEIRTAEVNALVSNVASIPMVRKALVRQQQALGVNGAIVMDGRYIGQTVFPDAELKIFMVASNEVRAQRRFDELKGLYEERYQAIEQQSKMIDERDARIAADEKLVAEKDAAIAEQTRLIDERDKSLADAHKIAEERLGIVQQQGNIILTLQQQNAEYEAIIKRHWMSRLEFRKRYGEEK